MKKKPTKKSTNQKEIDAFINKAEQPSKDNSYPWQHQDVDDFTVKPFNLKLPESYAIKLDYLVKNTVPKTSKQSFLLQHLLPLIDAELKKRDLPH